MNVQITLVNYEYPGVTDNCGGGGEVTHLLADGLRDRGHEVTVITDESDGHYATFPLRSYRRLSEHLSYTDVDVLHGHFSLPSSLALPRLAQQHDTPLVCSVMGADVYDPTRFRAIRPFARQLNKHIFEAADAVVAPSVDMQTRMYEQYNRKGRLIPYGVDIETGETSEADGPARILTVCRLVERKNLHTAIDSVEELRDRGVSVEYRIVGTGPLEAEIQARAQSHDWLTAPGYVEALDAEYNAADVFFLPSEHEAFGMVFLEAMAHGLPAVGSTRGGQTDFIVPMETGDVVPPNDPITQADRLQITLRNRDQLGRQAATVVDEDYSAERMTVEYESLYHEVTA